MLGKKQVVWLFRHACKLGLEGIVSKRKDSTYRSGRSPDWLKMKNPACAAVRREAEEDWDKNEECLLAHRGGVKRAPRGYSMGQMGQRARHG